MNNNYFGVLPQLCIYAAMQLVKNGINFVKLLAITIDSKSSTKARLCGKQSKYDAFRNFQNLGEINRLRATTHDVFLLDSREKTVLLILELQLVM